MQRTSEVFQPIPNHQQQQQQQQQNATLGRAQQSARERLFGISQNYGTVNHYSQQQQHQQHSSVEQELPNNRKIAMVKPELRSSEK